MAQSAGRKRVKRISFYGPHSDIGLMAALASFLADQIFKIWMVYGYRLTEHERVEMTSFFDLVLTWNKGVSYGMLTQGSIYGQWALGAFKIAVSLALIAVIARVAHRLLALALGLIIGGAMGNAVDRFWHGGVADFFSLHYNGFYWYIFNIADIAIVIGVALLIVEGFVKTSAAEKK